MQQIVSLNPPNAHTHRSGSGQKPILAWFENRLFLTDAQRQKVLCELQIRYFHNGRELLIPEIALPETNATQAVADVGFTEAPLQISEHFSQADST